MKKFWKLRNDFADSDFKPTHNTIESAIIAFRLWKARGLQVRLIECTENDITDTVPE